MRNSLLTGFSFGLTSGVITTLGLIVGLEAGTESRLVVLGGILTIAIADAFSDALGIHISQESQNRYSHAEVWLATISTLISKFGFALTFIIPIIIFPLSIAINICIFWGLIVLSIYSYFLARRNKQKIWQVVLEHLLIALVVIFLTHYLGVFLAANFR